MRGSYPRRYQGPIELVVLDWAGTTLDYGCVAPTVVFVEVFRRRGVPITMDQARRPMGLHKREHIRTIAQIDEVAAVWAEHHDAPIGEADIDAMFADFQPLQLACLADYAELIPGTLETVATLRERGIRIGSTTGYFTEAMELLQREAARRGYRPDHSVCATQVPAGRPEPWMVMQNMAAARVFPPAAVIKVDDTRPGIAEGLNAGAWAVGVAVTGNEVGLQADEIAALPQGAREQKATRARDALARAGAHYVIDSIAELPPVVEEIAARVGRGERP